MANVLIVEKSPLVAADISEVCGQVLSQYGTIVASSVEAAQTALSQERRIRACVVSGVGGTTDRHTLGILLAEAGVPAVVISEDRDETLSAFGSDAARVGRPFTTEMLARALASLSLAAHP